MKFIDISYKSDRNNLSSRLVLGDNWWINGTLPSRRSDRAGEISKKGDDLLKRYYVAAALSLLLTSLPAHADNPLIPENLLGKYYEGVSYFKAGDLDRAIKAFRQVVLSCPRDALARLSYAAALHQNGDIEDAIAEYRRAIALRPGDAFARESLGLLLQGQGQLDEALHQYNEAIKLRPDVPLLRLNVGIALRVRGQQDAAIQ